MVHKFNENQKKVLKRIWSDCKGQEQQVENFIGRLAYFLDTCPELITGSHKKIETQRSRDYFDVAKHCGKLLKALAKIPDIDRINLLSIYENTPLFSDPLDHVKGIQKRAEFQSNQLKKCKKYDQQLDDLRDFLNCFEPLQKISRYYFLDLAAVLWPEIDPSSFEKAYRPEEITQK